MHIFITGGATGIGEATIDELLRKFSTASFTLVDKNPSALQAKCADLTRRGIRNHGIACDITEIERLPAVVREACEKLGPIDLLVNNAGVMWVEDFSVMEWQRGKYMFDLLFTAPMRLVHEILPSLLERQSGGIINVASMAGKALLPGCTWYGAGKAALGHASEILHSEVQDRGIHVLTVYPGPIATDLEKGARQGYEDTMLTRLMPVGERDEMARRIVQAYIAKEAVVVYPAMYDIARHLHTLSGWLARKFAPKTRVA